MDIPKTKIVYDRHKRAGDNALGLVQIELYYGGKRRFFSTDVKVLPRHWHPTQMVIGRADAAALNSRILEVHRRIFEMVDEMIQRGDYSLPLRSKGKGDFISFCEEWIAERDIARTTKMHYRTMLNELQEFGRIKVFSDLTRDNIDAFDAHLRKKGIKQVSIYGYHKRLRCCINRAEEIGKITKSPYAHYRVARGKSEGIKFLTSEERHMVEIALIPDKRVAQARDLFIFSCYTGLAYGDLMAFRWEEVEKMGDKFVFRSNRIKNEEAFLVRLLPPAMRVLERYHYRLPHFANSDYNALLKSVAMLSGIKKPLTSHMGRHTFATWALSEGIPIEQVSKMLGHTNIETTQIYAKVLRMDVANAFDLLENRTR